MMQTIFTAGENLSSGVSQCGRETKLSGELDGYVSSRPEDDVEKGSRR